MKKLLILAVILTLLSLSGEALAEVNITIQVPANDTITDTTPDLNFTTDGSANITYNWDDEGNFIVTLKNNIRKVAFRALAPITHWRRKR